MVCALLPVAAPLVQVAVLQRVGLWPLLPPLAWGTLLWAQCVLALFAGFHQACRAPSPRVAVAAYWFAMGALITAPVMSLGLLFGTVFRI